MLIQRQVVLAIEAPIQHDPHEVCEGVASDLPIPRGALRVPCQYVGGQIHMLGTGVSGEILHGKVLPVEKKYEITVLGIRPDGALGFPRETPAN